jgi:hypothetical protein
MAILKRHRAPRLRRTVPVAVSGRLRFEVDGVWLAKGRFLTDAPNAPFTGDSKYLSVNLTASL